MTFYSLKQAKINKYQVIIKYCQIISINISLNQQLRCNAVNKRYL
uniref:Uncharacterized protein n=1 Tax=Arundo donax TaxID=35708 RepID=A0A0A8ZX55_ARUDO